MQIVRKAGINFAEQEKSPCYHKVSNGIMFLLTRIYPWLTRK